MTEQQRDADGGEEEEQDSTAGRAVTLRSELWVEWEESAALEDVARTINQTPGVSSVEEYTDHLEERFRETMEGVLPTDHATGVVIEPTVRAERIEGVDDE